MIRVLVTGSRGWTDEKTISDALREYAGGYDVVVHGACQSGADWMAEQCAERLDMFTEPHPADWSLGRFAGPVRNSVMVASGADVCLAFGPLERNGKRTGTGDCVAKARRAGIPVRHWPKPFEPEAK